MLWVFVVVYKHYSWVELLIFFSFLEPYMAPSGTVQASPPEGGFQVNSSSVTLPKVCGMSSVIGSYLPFLGTDQYWHYFSKQLEKKILGILTHVNHLKVWLRDKKVVT